MGFINIHNLQYSYATKKTPVTSNWCLSIPTLKISQGENVFVYGPSGCGKSTFLSLISGIIQPSSGELEIMGQDLAKLGSHKRDMFRTKNIGYIFQQFNLIPYLTIKENIILPTLLQKKLVSVENFEYLISRLNLEAILDQMANRVSVGQAQRAATARALILRPPVVLADEPTSSLDEGNQERFMRLLFEVVDQENSTLIFVSHNKALAASFSHKIELSQYSQAKSSKNV